MQRIRVLSINLAVVLLLLLGWDATSNAQSFPPAQGPDAPGPNASSLPAAVITGMVKAKVEEALAKINADLAEREDVRAKLAYSFTEYQPRIVSTQYEDRPNQRYVKIPYIFTYTVYDMQKHTAVGWIGYPWTRKISQSIDINISCNGWFTRFGQLAVSGDIDPPYLEAGHSISEQAVWAFVNGWLPDHIDSQIRQLLRNMNTSFTSTGLNLPCNRLGVATVSQGFPFNSIEYSVNRFGHFDIPLPDDITVRVLKIKRLRARANGQPLYHDTEDITVDFYVNQQPGTLGTFTMNEEQEAPITNSSIRLHRPGQNGNLILIFNVRQNDNPFTVDSDFQVYTSATNFGRGVRTIQVFKSYWQPPRPPLNKPLKVQIAAYEITYEIVAPPPIVIGPAMGVN